MIESASSHAWCQAHPIPTMRILVTHFFGATTVPVVLKIIGVKIFPSPAVPIFTFQIH
jgi:hypothetical protein